MINNYEPLTFFGGVAYAGSVAVVEDKASEGQLSFNDQTKGRVALAKKQKPS